MSSKNQEVELNFTELQHQETVHLDTRKVKDGDEALQILHTHFEPYTAAEEKLVRRKIDFHLVFLMLAVNGLQYIDKLTISYAATYGIITEDQLKGQEYSLLISIFYIGYLIAQYPTNVLMQRFPTGKYIAVNFTLWGAVLAATGAARNFSALAACRFFLGVFESCLNPGFILITSSWWKREEQAARVAVWYCANGLVSIPAGLIFYGIAFMKVDHIFPYQWMFIIFGGITFIFGLSLWWIMPNTPLTALWLNDRERLIAVERLKTNMTGLKNSNHKAVQVKEALLDPKVWMLVIGVFCHNMTNSLQSNFTGLITKGFGYDTFQAILLNLPNGFILTIAMLVVGFFLSSRWGEGKRIYAIILLYIPGIVSCALLYSIPVTPNTKAVHLFAIWLVPFVAVPAAIMYSLLASNIAGYTKKTVAGTLFFSAYCVANIVSPETFLKSQAPTYQDGIAVTLAAFCINIVLFLSLHFMYTRENAKRDADPSTALSSDPTEDMLDAFSDLTDLQNRKLRYKV